MRPHPASSLFSRNLSLSGQFKHLLLHFPACLAPELAALLSWNPVQSYIHRTQVWALGGNIQPRRHHRTRSVCSTRAHRRFTCALDRFRSYALTTSLTHNAHTGLFSVMIFVLTGFALMTRVNFAKVRVMLVSSRRVLRACLLFADTR